MNRKHHSRLSWLAMITCVALLLSTLSFVPAFAKSKTYTIKFKVHGETVSKQKVKKGEMPEIPAAPEGYTKDGVEYVFDRWDPEVKKAKKDMTYKAKFKKNGSETYTITWLDDKGNLIDQTTVKAGKKPKHDDPTKPSTEKYTYTFAGWKPKVTKAKGDATYTAKFEKKTRKYKITWLDYKGEEIDQTKVAYGKRPTHEVPRKKNSKKKDPNFKGWMDEEGNLYKKDEKLPKVTGDATYTAVSKKKDKKEKEPEKTEEEESQETPEDTGEGVEEYTITWADDEGNVIDRTTVKAGKKPKHDDPTMEPTEKYTYEFTGWTPEITEAAGDATYTATFREELRKYKISWLDDAGNVMDETKVAYGETPSHEAPVKKATDQYTYEFAGWEPALTEVTGPASYTAKFTATEIQQEQPQESQEQPQESQEQPQETQEQPQETQEQPQESQEQPQETQEQPEETQEQPQETQEQPEETQEQPEALTGEEAAAGTEEGTEKVENVTITFLNDDNSVLATISVLTGFQPKYDGTPISSKTDDFYVFDKWEDTGSGTKYAPEDLPEASVATTYKATYRTGTEGTDYWTITWQNEDGSALNPATTKVAVNTQPTHAEPTKADNNFIGWKDTSGTVYTSSNLPAATANMTYQAQYQTGSITIIIDPNNGEEKTTLKGNVGAKLPEIKNPTKANSALAGWKRNDKTEIDAALPTEFIADDDGKTYTAQWLTVSAVEDVNCYAFKPAAADAETYMNKERPASSVTVKLGDKPLTVETLTWSAPKNFKNAAATDESGDGKYEFTGVLTAKDTDTNTTYTAEVTCLLIVGPKTSGKSGDSYAYEYRWDDLNSANPKAIITKWSGGVDNEFDDKPFVIDSIIEGHAVIGIGKGAFKGTKLSELTVPAGVETIGDHAFASNSKLKKLTLPDSLISIGNNIIKDDANLTTLTLSASLETKLNSKTISHEYTKPDGTTAKAEVTLPMLTDIVVYAPGELELETSFVPESGHSVAVNSGARAYAKITWEKEDGSKLATTSEDYDKSPQHTGPEKAETDTKVFTFKGWKDSKGSVHENGKLPKVTGPAIYRAEYSEKTRVYTIKFVNYDGKALDKGEVTVEFTGHPKYEGATPTRADDDSYRYSFKGWKNSKNTEYDKDATLPSPKDYKDGGETEGKVEETYTAEFTRVPIYTIKFLDGDGEVLQDKKYEEGATPKYEKEKEPTKTETDELTYKFNGGWKASDGTVYKKGKALPAVTGEETYTAQFDSSDRLYTIKFVDSDGKALDKGEVTVKYTEHPKYAGTTPTKAADSSYTYTFKGWKNSKGTEYSKDATLPSPKDYKEDKEGSEKKGKVEETYTAQFEQKSKSGGGSGGGGSGTDTTVTLVYDQYTGDTLTKVYDLNKYGAYKKNGEVVYIIPELKTISSKVKLKPSSGSWVEGHTSVKPKLSLSKQFSSADVGDYEFEFKITGLTGADAAYYDIEPTTIKIPAKITPRPVAITPRAGTSKVYGTSDPVYKSGTYLSTDKSSPLHQDVGGVPSYGVPLNTKDGKATLTITNSGYLLKAAENKGVAFFPGWLSRESGEDVKEYRITQGGMDFSKYYGKNFSVTVNKEAFKITQKDISEADVTVSQPGNQQYDGKEKTPEVTVTYNSKVLDSSGQYKLVKDKDYTITYANNKEVGTAKVTLKGKGNFKGTVTKTFSILKTSDASGDSTDDSGSGSSGGGSYGGGGGGFENDDFDDETEEDENDPNAPENVGKLKVDDVEYDTILFGADGKPRPFITFVEDMVPEEEEAIEEEADEALDDELELEDDEAEEPAAQPAAASGPKLRSLMIIPEPLTDPETHDPTLLEGTEREKYEELHLRLTTSTAQALANNGFGEIVYELEQATMRIPLTALGNEILIPAPEPVLEEDEEGDDLSFGDADESDEDEDDEEDDLDFDEEDDEEDGEAFEDEGIPEDADVIEAEPEMISVPVEGYDICIEQADATGLTERETALLALVADDGVTPQNKQLTPAYRARVRMIPVDAEQIPTGEMDENEEPITIPYTEPLPEGYTLPDTTLFMKTYESLVIAPPEAQLVYASLVSQPGDPDVSEVTPAEFGELEDVQAVEITAIKDGFYGATVPADWDPAPYMEEAADDELEFEDDGEDDELLDLGGDIGDADAGDADADAGADQGPSEPVNADYPDAASFEAALNAGTNMVGKVVQFEVSKIGPKASYGYTLIAGEHLNFCLPDDPKVAVGDLIAVEVTEVSEIMGSYVIDCVKK